MPPNVLRFYNPGMLVSLNGPSNYHKPLNTITKIAIKLEFIVQEVKQKALGSHIFKEKMGMKRQNC